MAFDSYIYADETIRDYREWVIILLNLDSLINFW